MKKCISLFFLMVLCTNLLGCYRNSFSVQQSADNFQAYRDIIQHIADKYELKVTASTDCTTSDHDNSEDVCIQINANAYINIRMINSAEEGDNGAESFHVEYILDGNNAIPESDIRLFVELTNSISGKELSYDLCRSFLNAPESEYAAEKYGFQKANGEIVAKMHPMNFWEDWVLCYFETLDKKQLSFGGLTKSK